MRRFIDFAPDGGEGAGEGGTGEGGEGAGGAAEAGGEAAKTFSRDDVNRIVTDRLARQKAQFGDYDDLKSKAAEFDKIAEAQKTELQKATERATAAEAEKVAAQERAQALITEASITAVATGKLADPTDAVALIDRGAIEYGEDGKPTNIGALVDALVEAKPHLSAGKPAPKKIDQGAQGATGATLDDAMALGDSEFLKAIGG